MPHDLSDPLLKLDQIIDDREISVQFQPIIDLANSDIVGYEGQIRGPSDDLLHSPVRLYRLAKQAGRLLDMENLCSQMTVDNFVELKLRGLLFLRQNIDVFLDHKFKELQLMRAVETAGMDPQQIVVTLCVHEPYDIDNPNLLSKIVSRYIDQNYKVAIEDHGEVFSMLHSGHEIYPSCLRIGRYLIQDLDKDPVKVQLIKSLQKTASERGVITLADDIETRGELLLARDLGISLGQGSFIARANKRPIMVLPREVRSLLNSGDDAHMHGVSGIDAILEKVPDFTLRDSNEDIFQLFEHNPQVSVVAVTNNKVPVGLINRSVFINRFARPYQRELYGKKPCSTFMDPEPLIVDRGISIQALSRLLAEDQRHVSLGFIFTENGHYLGIGTSQKLIHEITELQIQSARYANPLTGLPGNTPISRQIDDLLATGEEFCACYFDLDNFKPFNDVYGFSMGDSMIQMTAKIIREQCDPEVDFVGHIGGDDFIALFRSQNWEERCHLMLEHFGKEVMSFFTPQDIERGGYVTENRRGEVEFHNLASISIGAVRVRPGMFSSHREIASVAAESKKMAKKIHGNSLFINQRSYAAQADRPDHS